MENKIQELADKIYREGVEKGYEEAQRLICEAQKQAQKIIDDARNEAESILSAAKKSSDELSENTKSELKLFAGQAVNALKTEITNLLTNQTVADAVKNFTSDKDYFNKFILTLAKQWTQTEPVVIAVEDEMALKSYFIKNAKDLLDKGVKIESVKDTKVLFTISPADGSYKVNFGEEELENYFKEFLRPQLIKMLF